MMTTMTLRLPVSLKSPSVNRNRQSASKMNETQIYNEHTDGFREGSVNGVRFLEIYLKPVGKTVFSRSSVQLKTALLCILRCVRQLHSLGYFHTDIRWFNVMMYGDNGSILIVMTFVLKLTAIDSWPSRDRDAEWYATDDLLQVMALVRTTYLKSWIDLSTKRLRALP